MSVLILLTCDSESKKKHTKALVLGLRKKMKIIENLFNQLMMQQPQIEQKKPNTSYSSGI